MLYYCFNHISPKSSICLGFSLINYKPSSDKGVPLWLWNPCHVRCKNSLGPASPAWIGRMAFTTAVALPSRRRSDFKQRSTPGERSTLWEIPSTQGNIYIYIFWYMREHTNKNRVYVSDLSPKLAETAWNSWVSSSSRSHNWAWAPQLIGIGWRGTNTTPNSPC